MARTRILGKRPRERRAGALQRQVRPVLDDDGRVLMDQITALAGRRA